MATKPISNIAVAFAAQSAGLNIPKPRDTALHPVPDTSKHQPGLLPTPPNSISPTLPPHKHRSEVAYNSTNRSSPPVDSDIDLQDAVEHAAAQDHPTALSHAALSGLETAGAITPAMLAKHHLPDILLHNGPMAIRHVLNQLAQSVPGFSRIPPAKARRLVVAALESRGGGGLTGDVEFEKVGWGRWDARLKGQAPREGRSVSIQERGAARSAMSPPDSVPDSYAMSSMGSLQIPRAGRYKRDPYSGSWAGDSALSSRDEEMTDMNMAEHEADKMSLDGSSAGNSDSDMEIPGLEEDLDDVTDAEDWAALGPEAFRQPNKRARKQHYVPRDYNYMSRTLAVRKRLSSLQPPLPKHSASYQYSRSGSTRALSSSLASRGNAGTSPLPSALGSSPSVNGINNGVLGQGHDSQERAAIEALLKMGSM